MGPRRLSVEARRNETDIYWSTNVRNCVEGACDDVTLTRTATKDGRGESLGYLVLLIMAHDDFNWGRVKRSYSEAVMKPGALRSEWLPAFSEVPRER